jgi:hypothetical protein
MTTEPTAVSILDTRTGGTLARALADQLADEHGQLAGRLEQPMAALARIRREFFERGTLPDLDDEDGEPWGPSYADELFGRRAEQLAESIEDAYQALLDAFVEATRTEIAWTEWCHSSGEPSELGCYSCTRKAGGDPFAPDSEHPRRKVVRSFTIEEHRDPTAAYELDCGHSII